jgi:hypothetical protein
MDYHVNLLWRGRTVVTCCFQDVDGDGLLGSGVRSANGTEAFRGNVDGTGLYKLFGNQHIT